MDVDVHAYVYVYVYDHHDFVRHIFVHCIDIFFGVFGEHVILILYHNMHYFYDLYIPYVIDHKDSYVNCFLKYAYVCMGWDV